MFITRLQLKNWRNFRSLDIHLRDVTYILGPNAAGKSNLLDALRFLRDVSRPRGGGLQAAIDERRGLSKIRCLHARTDPNVEIDVELSESPDGPVSWRYELAFKPEGKGAQRILVTKERVWHGERVVLNRPDKGDQDDPTRLTQTHLEQIQTNAKFRIIADFFGSITYLHLVPQLLRFADRIGGQTLENDPFGQGFLGRLAKTPEKTRNARLNKIGKALQLAVPQFQELRFEKDELGHPHLSARYAHYRPNAGWQREDQFSDGTLRLLGLLWGLLDGSSPLLLEEPEISLNDGIVTQIPVMLSRLQRDRKSRRQVVISTHSEALLGNPGIDGRSVVLLESKGEGTTARGIKEEEKDALNAGLTIAEVVLPKTRPETVHQLALWK